MAKEKVLITGGAGYLGSVLTGHLLEENYKVTCLDNLLYNQRSLFNFASHPNFDFVYGDARDKNLIKGLALKVDVIIPLAAIVGMPACERYSKDSKSINLASIQMLNEIRSKEQKIIYPNTNSGYGTQSEEVHCTEETSLNPISLYGKLKCQAETFLLEGDKDVITLRLATVFGNSPRMRTDLLVNDFVLKAMREKSVVIYEGDFKRNYIHIKDIARCFEYCIKNFEKMKNEPYNVGLNDANLSKIELSEKIKEFIPEFEIIRKEIGKDPDKRNYTVSNKKINAAGFQPIFSLEDGIKELIKGYEILLIKDPLKNI